MRTTGKQRVFINEQASIARDSVTTRHYSSIPVSYLLTLFHQIFLTSFKLPAQRYCARSLITGPYSCRRRHSQELLLYVYKPPSLIEARQPLHPSRIYCVSFDPSARHSRLEPLSTTLLPRSLALSPSPCYCVLSLSPSSSMTFQSRSLYPS